MKLSERAHKGLDEVRKHCLSKYFVGSTCGTLRETRPDLVEGTVQGIINRTYVSFFKITFMILLSVSCSSLMAQQNQMDFPAVKRQKRIQQEVVRFCADKPDGPYHFSTIVSAFGSSGNDSVNCHCVSNKPHGPWQLYVNKKHVVNGAFNHGLEDGEWTFLQDNGKVDIKAAMKDGMMHGATKSWYENGRLLSEKNYVSGLLQGHDITYFEDGHEWINVTYKDGLYHGKFLEWKNGDHKLYLDLNFYEGKLHGTQLYYHTNGKKAFEVVYDHDKVVSGKSWNEQGVEIPYDESKEPKPRYDKFF
jgi:antitoxin component YwqK of YwqJK toxin-antitoxin module